MRALAQRSAASAREIKGLITSSVEHVAAGTGIVQQAGATIVEIVGQAPRVSDALDAIAAGACHQAQGVSQTACAVQKLDAVTQRNAALVDETAAAAAALRAEAQALASEVARIRLPLPAKTL